MISVVVPVYNAETYIEKCINSIIDQTFSDWELIIVDDESSDNSLCICNRLANEDKRIRVVSQKNGGPSNARNYGISLAQGDYLAFIDADDYVEKNYLEYLLKELTENNCEMSSCGWYVRDVQGNQEEISPFFEPQVFNLYDLYSEDCVIPFTVWHNLYSMAVIKGNNVRFDESVFYLEDLLFNFSFLKYTKRFVNSCKPLYNWIDIPTSLTRIQMNADKFEKWYTKIEAREMICQMNAFNSQVIEANYDSLLFESAMMLSDIKKNKIDSPEKEMHVRDNIKKYRKRVFRKGGSFSAKRKLRLFFLCYAGIEIKRGINK